MRHNLLLAIAGVTIVAACTTDNSRTFEVNSGAYAGDTITMRTGDTLLLRLRSNPSTGYTWARNQAAADAVTLLDSTFAAPATTAAGAPGEQLFRFLAQNPGSATLALYYARPWESGNPPVDSVVINLRVTAR